MATRVATPQVGGTPCSRHARIAPGESVEAFIDRIGVFAIDDQGVARLPVLVAGALLIPELPAADKLEEALNSGLRSVDVGETHLFMADAEVDGQSCAAWLYPD